MKFFLFSFIFLLALPLSYSQVNSSEDSDELDEIIFDVGEDFFDDEEEIEALDERKAKSQPPAKERLRPKSIEKVMTKKVLKKPAPKIKNVAKDKKTITVDEFDVGEEEKEMLELAKNIGNKLSHDEWNEIARTTPHSTYKIVKDDTLWSISKSLFGTGFYYSKIWSLNPYITNPHQIEPGMVLAFSSGSEQSTPQIKLGDFSSPSEQTASDADTGVVVTKTGKGYSREILAQFADEGYPNWLDERKELIEKGYYVESASGFSYDDLQALSSLNLVKEYKNYDPPKSKFTIERPHTFDSSGFDKSSIIRKEIKSGFYLNTSLVTNIVQDFGEIESGITPAMILGLHDIVYVRFDPQVTITPGDKFSIYEAGGIVEHDFSEREGYRYTIKGDILVKEKKNDLWESEVIKVSGVIERGDRLTTYTPSIEKILTTYNQKRIEAIIIAGFEEGKSLFSQGDVVYLDRGRADGVELGNIFNVYSFMDRSTNEAITEDPTYKIGELAVISLSDDFATAIIQQGSHEISLGQLVVGKTLEQAMREKGEIEGKTPEKLNKIEQKALEELDVQLDLDDVGSELKKEADKIELTEDEIEELQRQEREKSFIKEHESDRQELDRLEQEVEQAQGLLDEVSEDQNKQLEQEDLERLEENLERPGPDAFESLDEIEDEVGKKYLDEDINAKSNPYGLTEFDLEEVDELLNTIPEDDEREDDSGQGTESSLGEIEGFEDLEDLEGPEEEIQGPAEDLEQGEEIQEN